MPEVGTWQCPLPGGGQSEELVLRFGATSENTVLIIPPLFNEHNLLRRQLVEVMRRLLAAGKSTAFPDLPGWNESLQPLEKQTLSTWRETMAEAARQLKATHVLAVRSGALLAPTNLPGWVFAPQSGAQLVRKMVRAQLVANQEAGQSRTRDEIHAEARERGIRLAGHSIGAELFVELEAAPAPSSENLTEISVEEVAGAGLWARSEPGENSEQADDLAERILSDLPGSKGDVA